MKTVTVEATVHQNLQKVWEYWTSPEHIIQWNFASAEWHCPAAEHNLTIGGKLKYHMAARDGSMAFDYTGTFTDIIFQQLLEHRLDDGRKVTVRFTSQGSATRVVESFEVEDEHNIEMQRQGWQAILDNFKSYVESK